MGLNDGYEVFLNCLCLIGADNNDLKISNIRGDLILQMNLCGKIQTLKSFYLLNRKSTTKIYFDCIDSNDDSSMSERSERKYYVERSTSIAYDQLSYNFTKPLLDTRQFVDNNRPMLLYDHSFRNSTEDWCEGNPEPELYVPVGSKVLKNANEISQSILSELQEIRLEMRAQNNASEAILLELQRIKASIDASTSDAKQNAVAVANNLNVSDL